MGPREDWKALEKKWALEAATAGSNNAFRPFEERPSDMVITGANEWHTKDSGVRETMETGSQRDSREGKGRYDLLSPFALQRLAGVYERGAVKYDARNWELGQAQMRYFDSAIRHLMNWYEGKEDEDHLAQAMWNVAAMVHQDELIRRGVERYEALDDRPTYWRPSDN